MAAVGVALAAEAGGWGLLNNLTLPEWAAVAIAVVVLDLVIYLQHVMFHFVPVLWRLHRMHHADLDIDVTTGARFHPVEILLSMVIKMAAVAALGAPAAGVVAFEVLLNATAMFNHANVKLPLGLDRILTRRDRHARHAPGPSFGPPRGDRQQFRLQPVALGPIDGHLSRPAPRRPRRHGASGWKCSAIPVTCASIGCWSSRCAGPVRVRTDAVRARYCETAQVFAACGSQNRVRREIEQRLRSYHTTDSAPW